MSSKLILLGRDHQNYGHYHLETLGQSAAAISIGADKQSPSLRFKGDPDSLNEDALWLFDDGDHVAIAVADAHFGWSSSHCFITNLANLNAPWPETARALHQHISSISDPDPANPASETTLLVALYQRSTKRGFGVSFGDSSLVIVNSQNEASPLNERNANYVTPSYSPSLRAQRARLFDFQAQSGDLILGFTDGIDECCYRQPERSIRPGHLKDCFAKTGPAPEAYARRLVEMALAGVDGEPGGQDNIALVVALA